MSTYQKQKFIQFSLPIVLILTIFGFFYFFYQKPDACHDTHFGIKFSCPNNTQVQYWPNIYNTEYVLINPDGHTIAKNQDNDANLYQSGILIYRFPLPNYQPHPKNGKELIMAELAQQEKNRNSNVPPIIPGPGKLISENANRLPNWKGAAVQEAPGGMEKYVNVKDGYVYELYINSINYFTKNQLDLILSSFAWSE